MSKRVVIVGGGLAGLAAAEALSAEGLAVTLLEARPRLGGRASSFDDKTSGTLIDNCQHVSLGCCTNFRDFCKRTGLAASFRVERQLNFIGSDGVVNRLKADTLPAPFHLARSFHRLSYLENRDRIALARGLSALAKSDAGQLNGETFDLWLARHGQTENAVNRFWHVVLVSALSESLDRIAVAEARKVFVDAFLAHREGWTVQIPTAPLGDLYGKHLVSHLGTAGRRRSARCRGSATRDRQSPRRVSRAAEVAKQSPAMNSSLRFLTISPLHCCQRTSRRKPKRSTNSNLHPFRASTSGLTGRSRLCRTPSSSIG